MKICITSTGDNLDASLDPRFGRCGWFLMVDMETMEFEAMANSAMDLSGGAGTAAAQAVIEKDIDAVITGGCGPNAARVLEAAGADVYLADGGNIKELLGKLKNGELNKADFSELLSGAGRFGGGLGRGRGTGGPRGGGFGGKRK